MSSIEQLARAVLGPIAGLFMGPEPSTKDVVVALLKAGGSVLQTGVAGDVPPIVSSGISGLVALLNAADSSGQRDALMGLAEGFAAEAERLKFGPDGSGAA